MTNRIEKSVVLDAPIERVWQALTDHEEFGQWFRVKLDGPFVVGQPTTGRMTYPGYNDVKWESLTETMDPPRLFVFTWPCPEGLHTAPDARASRMRVEFRLEATATGTRVTVTESGFAGMPADRRTDAMRQIEEGWEEQMRNIKAYLDA
jgi:uncharacterized protein YndB with AHSA1/START domain